VELVVNFSMNKYSINILVATEATMMSTKSIVLRR